MSNIKYHAYHYLLAAATTTPAPYYYTGHIHMTRFVRQKYLPVSNQRNGKRFFKTHSSDGDKALRDNLICTTIYPQKTFPDMNNLLNSSSKT